MGEPPFGEGGVRPQEITSAHRVRQKFGTFCTVVLVPEIFGMMP